MTHLTNPSVLASSTMTAPHISDHSTYYHEDEHASVPTSEPGHAETTGPPSPTNLPPRRLTTSEIGQWKTFATGPFVGRTVRAEIVEVQKADLGRKCADPPTSVSSAAAGSGSHGGEDGEGMGVGSRTGKERERERHDRDLGGEKEKEKDSEGRAEREDRRPFNAPPVVSLQLFESVHHGTPHQYERAIPTEDVEIDGLICQVDLYRAPIDPDALPPPSESDKLTRVLFGESYVHACSLDLSGRPALNFVFAGLSVKLEGLFRPRYRFFDLFSWTAGSADVPVLAQCFGGAFAV